MKLEVKLYEIEDVPDTSAGLFYCHHPVFSDLQRVERFSTYSSRYFFKGSSVPPVSFGHLFKYEKNNATHNNVTYKCLHFQSLPMGSFLGHFNMHNGLLYHQILLKSVRSPTLQITRCWNVSVPI